MSIVSNKNSNDLLFEWDESLSIGIKEIDEQHKHIISTLDQICRDVADSNFTAMQLLILNLKFYIEEHFQCEENYMFYIGYPQYSEHKRSHDRLLSEIDHILAAYLRSGEIAMDDIVNLISICFFEDMKIEDLDIGKYAASQNGLSPETVKKILKPMEDIDNNI